MKFVIYGPHYDDNSGGSIALYKLGRLLTQLGHEASVWHWTRYHPHESRLINGKYSTYFNFGVNVKLEDDPRPFDYQVASQEDIDDGIVVYPEVVEGNPLGGRRVVRWLLNKPGAVLHPCAFGVDELTFYFSEVFLPDGWDADPTRKLRVLDWKDDIYSQTNSGVREGACYMVRKGLDLPLTYHPHDAVPVDGMSHQELAAVFNRCQQFICYDPFTAYLAYASLSGCDSVAVPRAGLSAQQWREATTEFGIAYGFDDVERARRTRPELIAYVKNTEAENLDMVNHFVAVCRARFPGAA